MRQTVTQRSSIGGRGPSAVPSGVPSHYGERYPTASPTGQNQMLAPEPAHGV